MGVNMIRHIPKILVLNLIAIFMTINAVAQTPAQTYHYAARIPATAQSCQAEAEALGVRFASTTKAKVSETTCRGTITMTADGSTYNLYSLLLTYQAASKINPSSTILGGSSVSTTPGDGS